MIQHCTTTYKRFLILLLLYSGCSLINLTLYHYLPYSIFKQVSFSVANDMIQDFTVLSVLFVGKLLGFLLQKRRLEARDTADRGTSKGRCYIASNFCALTCDLCLFCRNCSISQRVQRHWDRTAVKSKQITCRNEVYQRSLQLETASGERTGDKKLDKPRRLFTRNTPRKRQRS